MMAMTKRMINDPHPLGSTHMDSSSSILALVDTGASFTID